MNHLPKPLLLVVVHHGGLLCKLLTPRSSSEVVVVGSIGSLAREIQSTNVMDWLWRGRSDDLATDVVVIPSDGPLHAVEMTVEAIALQRGNVPTVALVSAPPGEKVPPQLEVLELIGAAGLIAAVDCYAVEWRNTSGLWWSTRGGVRRLPLMTSTRRDARRTAAVLLGLCAFSEEGVLDRWLSGIADGAIVPRPDEWEDALAARYVEIALDRLRQR